jgi:hypothetical protein
MVWMTFLLLSFGWQMGLVLPEAGWIADKTGKGRS